MRQFALFTPRHDRAEHNSAHKGVVMQKHKALTAQKHKAVTAPKRSQTQAPPKRSRRRNIENMNPEESYDLSAFFTFSDDPDADVSTVGTGGTTRVSSPKSAPEVEAEADLLIRFDFDPAVSLGLGLCTHHEQASESYTGPEPVFFRPEGVQSVITTSMAPTRGIGRQQSALIKADLRETALANKLSRTRKHYAKRKLKLNPHNEHLAGIYDASRIERALEMLNAIPENDATFLKRRKPLHQEIEIEYEEAEMSLDLAFDGGTTVAGYSVRPELRVTQQPNLPLEHVQELKVVDPQAEDAFDLVSPIEAEDQDVDVYIPPTEKLTGTFKPFDTLLLEDKLSATRSFDDALSVNNTFAVKRFISAPRLCEGTKGVPSIISVSSIDSDNDDYIVFSAEAKTPAQEKKAVLRSKSPQESKVLLPSASAGDSKSRSSKKASDRRVKNHIAQLSNVLISLSNDSDDSPSAGVAGSRNSFGSPNGVDQLDARKPWRKPTTILENEASDPEEELILHLKARVRKLIAAALPTIIEIDKNNIDLDRAHSYALKAHLRNIEAVYFKDDGERTVRSAAAGSSIQSIQKLKARMRQIESNIGGAKMSILPVPVH